LDTRLLSPFSINDTATTDISTLSLHDALPIFAAERARQAIRAFQGLRALEEASRHSRRLHDRKRHPDALAQDQAARSREALRRRSEEHTSELQSLTNLVCRLLLEKKKKDTSDVSDVNISVTESVLEKLIRRYKVIATLDEYDTMEHSSAEVDRRVITSEMCAVVFR